MTSSDKPHSTSEVKVVKGIVNIERDAFYTNDLFEKNGKSGSKKYSNDSTRTHSTTISSDMLSCNPSFPVKWLLAKITNIQLFPTFRKYSFKSNLLLDINAALILTALVIPQCMAYAILAKMPPVVGIYISIIQPLLYAIMGTCPTASFGTFALLSMLVGDSIDEICVLPEACSETDRISIGASLSLIMGLTQMCMMVLNFGKIAQFLDQTVVRAFTTAVAFHIGSSQIKNVFFGSSGITHSNRIPPSEFPVLGKLYEAGVNIEKFNFMEFSIFFCSLSLLLPSKAIVQMLKKRWKYVEFPMDFIVVFIAAFLNYSLKLDKNFGISSVGQIRFQTTSIPPNYRFSFKIFQAALVLSIVTVSMHLSFIKVFNSKNKDLKKKKTKTGADQEILAAGFTNFVASWFSCYPGTVSLSRSVVLFENEAKSQLTGVISSCFMVVAYLLLRSALGYIPMAVLAAIIVTALRNLFKQFKDVPQLYRKSKLELMVWLVTFAMAFVFSCEIGLLVGFCASICRHLYLQNQATVKVLQTTNTAADLLVEKDTISDLAQKTEVNFCNVFSNSALTNAPFFALRVTGPISSITVDYITKAITSYTKQRLPGSYGDETVSFITKNSSKNDSDMKPRKRFILCPKKNSAENIKYEPLLDEGSVNLIQNGHSQIDEEERTCHDEKENDVHLSVEGDETTSEHVDQTVYFILDLNHVAYFDYIGMKQFQEMLLSFSCQNLIVLCCRQDIENQLQNNWDEQEKKLRVVPTFVDALACIPNSNCPILSSDLITRSSSKL